MTQSPRRARSRLGLAVLFLTAGGVVLFAGAVVNGCRINKLLGSRSSVDGPLVVTPPEVRDSALAGSTTARVANLSVSNPDGWFAAADEGWIRMTPWSASAAATVRLSLDPKHLSPGLHQGRVTVQERDDEGATVTVPVRFMIFQPVLMVRPDDFEYQARTSNSVFYDTIRITNEGTGPLKWTARKVNGAGWLQLGADSGSAPGIIPIRASNEGLSYFGTFRETIIVTSPGAKNSPFEIEISIRRRKRGDDDDDG